MKTWLDGYNSAIYQIVKKGNIFDTFSHKVNIEELSNSYKQLAKTYRDHISLDTTLFCNPDLDLLVAYEKELGDYDRRNQKG